tara:strand:+ start:174 stop:1589 length:1416 start_codon:yes stop_codon:yes gene_type:complete
MKFNIVYDRRIVSEVEDRIIPNGINSNSNNFANEHGENPMSKVIYQEFNTRERDNEFTLEFLKKECDWKVNEIFLDEVSDKVLDNQINLYPIFPTNPYTCFVDQPFTDFLSTRVLNLIRNKKLKLVIVNSSEAFEFEFLKPLCHNLKKCNLEEVEVIVTTSDLAAPSRYTKYIEDLTVLLDQDDDDSKLHIVVKECNIRFVSINYYGAGSFIDTDWMENMKDDGVIPFKDDFLQKLKNKKKFKYLNYNGVGKPHRFISMSELYRRKLDRHGLNSYLCWDSTPENDLLIAKNIKTSKNVDNHFSTFCEKLPILLDYDVEIHKNGHRYSNLEHMVDSYFSIVTESCYFGYEHGSIPEKLQYCPVFLTEKTYRTLLYHPFILMAAPHSLKYLKEFGYKTFPKIFDESYDDIEDTVERLFFIVDEVERVCNLKSNKLHELYVDYALPIIRHNQQNFLKCNPKNLYKTFFEEIIYE